MKTHHVGGTALHLKGPLTRVFTLVLEGFLDGTLLSVVHDVKCSALTRKRQQATHEVAMV